MTQEQASNLITKVRQSGTSLINSLNEFRTDSGQHSHAVDTINTVLNGLNQKTIGDVYAIKL